MQRVQIRSRRITYPIPLDLGVLWDSKYSTLMSITSTYIRLSDAIILIPQLVYISFICYAGSI